MLNFAAEDLGQLHEIILGCTRCRLAKTRKNVVPGEGSPKASIMLVGEAPGGREDSEGRPFVGSAGKLLNELIGSVGLRRQDVFITSVVKCRPPSNRLPRKDEVASCIPFLSSQVKILQPKVICAMGNLAVRVLVDGALSVTRVHGVPRRKDDVVFFPMYHPAAALYTYRLRQTMMQDFKRLGDFLSLGQPVNTGVG